MLRVLGRFKVHPKNFEFSRPFLEVKSDLDFSKTPCKDIRRHQTFVQWYY